MKTANIKTSGARPSRSANIAELKNNLSVYLKDVKNGDEVIVSERNVPFARIVPFNPNEDYDTVEQKLVAEGVLAPPSVAGPLPDHFWEDHDLPSVPLDKILEVLREERDER